MYVLVDLTAIQESTDDLLSDVEEMLSQLREKRDSLEPALEELHSRLDQVEESWSGSWLGHHANLYYEDFQRPPPQHRFDPSMGTTRGVPGDWYEVSFEAIRTVIEGEGIEEDLEGIQEVAETYENQCERLLEEIQVGLSPIRQSGLFSEETELLEGLESETWGFSSSEMIRAQRPNNFVSSDMRAMSEGLQVPPHVAYRAKLLSAQSKLDSLADFCKDSRRILRQTRTKAKVGEVGSEPSDSTSKATQGLIQRICRGFHRAARQLRDRHENRPTLQVEDEYDVQDLLHTILRLHFEDVRAEEYTPSYAQSSSRMDFLLKEDGIAIEVKKTRQSLSDKDLANQLLIDIARYKSHPSCDTLVCFVYDPEFRVGNPKGLEQDLNETGDEDLSVLGIVAPR